MTPEQLELLALKCKKQDCQQADLTLAALQSAISMAFGGKTVTPSDMLDAKLGFAVGEDAEYITDGPVPETVTQLRKAKFGHWDWPDEQLLEWLIKMAIKSKSDDYAIDQYFTQKELDKYGICLLKERENERNNPFRDDD